MEDNQLQKMRIEYNYKCACILSELIAIYPDLRINQIISILNGSIDRFYEEPNTTYERWVQSDFYKKSKN